MSSFNITFFSKWKRNFLALTRKRHPGFQAIGRDIQVFRQWQKTSRFSCCCKRQPSKVWSVTLLHGEASLPGWLDFVLIGHHHQSPITNHQSITITNSQSPITCWTSSWPSLARARCPGRTEPALLLPDQNNDLMTTFIWIMMTLKSIMIINKSLKTFSGLSTKGSATLSTWVPNCPFSKFHLFS